LGKRNSEWLKSLHTADFRAKNYICIHTVNCECLFNLELNFPPTFFSELGGLLKYVRPFLNSISKAKAARLVRSLLDLFLDMEAATGQEVDLCLECIEWAKAEKRTFLRQALEVRLGACSLIVFCAGRFRLTEC